MGINKVAPPQLSMSIVGLSGLRVANTPAVNVPPPQPVNAAMIDREIAAIESMFREDAKRLNDRLNKLEIKDAPSLTEAEILLVDVKKKIKDVEDDKPTRMGPFNSVIKMFHDKYNEFIGTTKAVKGEFVRIKEVLEPKMKAYLIAENERMRKENETKALEAKKAEDKAKADLEAAAKVLEESGNIAVAESLRAQAGMVHVPIITEQAASSSASSASITKQQFICEVVDINLVPDEYIIKTADMKKLNKLAEENGGKNPPAGVRFIEDFSFKSKRGI